MAVLLNNSIACDKRGCWVRLKFTKVPHVARWRTWQPKVFPVLQRRWRSWWGWMQRLTTDNRSLHEIKSYISELKAEFNLFYWAPAYRDYFSFKLGKNLYLSIDVFLVFLKIKHILSLNTPKSDRQKKRTLNVFAFSWGSWEFCHKNLTSRQVQQGQRETVIIFVSFKIY